LKKGLTDVNMINEQVFGSGKSSRVAQANMSAHSSSVALAIVVILFNWYLV